MTDRRPLRLVIDTNVALDLLVFADRQAAPILAAIEAGEAVWLTTTTCREELRRVLDYPELKLSRADQDAAFRRYQELTREPEALALLPADLPRCRDVDDQPFLELAAASSADLLVSRDRELLRLRRRIRDCLVTLDIVQPVEAARRMSSFTGERTA